MACLLGVVDRLACFSTDKHLLRVHLVLRKVLYFNFVKVAEGAVKGDERELDALYFHALHQLAAEVKAGSRGGDGAFVLGENALEVV